MFGPDLVFKTDIRVRIPSEERMYVVWSSVQVMSQETKSVMISNLTSNLWVTSSSLCGDFIETLGTGRNNDILYTYSHEWWLTGRVRDCKTYLGCRCLKKKVNPVPEKIKMKGKKIFNGSIERVSITLAAMLCDNSKCLRVCRCASILISLYCIKIIFECVCVHVFTCDT